MKVNRYRQTARAQRQLVSQESETTSAEQKRDSWTLTAMTVRQSDKQSKETDEH